MTSSYPSGTLNFFTFVAIWSITGYWIEIDCEKKNNKYHLIVLKKGFEFNFSSIGAQIFVGNKSWKQEKIKRISTFLRLSRRIQWCICEEKIKIKRTKARQFHASSLYNIDFWNCQLTFFYFFHPFSNVLSTNWERFLL